MTAFIASNLLMTNQNVIKYIDINKEMTVGLRLSGFYGDPNYFSAQMLVSIAGLLIMLSMVKNKKLELRYTLTWILTSFCFIILSLFPDILRAISDLLHIIEPVNTLFLLIIFFLLVISFTITLVVSKNANRVKTLTQELALIKSELEKLKKESD